MISTERIDELRSEVGAEDFGEIVDLFLTESDLLLNDLRAVADPAAAEALLHSLKGSALNLGFVDLADLCEEGRATGISRDDWADRLTRISEVYQMSRSRLADLG